MSIKEKASLFTFFIVYIYLYNFCPDFLNVNDFTRQTLEILEDPSLTGEEKNQLISKIDKKETIIVISLFFMFTILLHYVNTR